MSRTAAARRLTSDEIQRIRKLLDNPEMTLNQIAARFHRSSETIRQVSVRYQARPIRKRG